MPQGDVRGTGWEFYDATYDGYWDGELRRGLGLLTDGKIGPENFRLGYYNYGKSKSGGFSMKMLWNDNKFTCFYYNNNFFVRRFRFSKVLDLS